MVCVYPDKATWRSWRQSRRLPLCIVVDTDVPLLPRHDSMRMIDPRIRDRSQMLNVVLF
jgi:hypothetical protein